MRDVQRPLRPLLLAIAIGALVAIPVLAVGPRGALTSPSPSTDASAVPSTAPASTAPSTDAPTAAARATPSISASPDRTTQPTTPQAGGSGKPDKDKSSKGQDGDDEAPAVTVTGTLGTKTDADGDTEYTLTTGSTTLLLEAGPKWFYGDKHPLQPFVGKRVTVVGEQATGSNELEVRSVNGTLIRGDGKPPWAGGWKRVGKIHPGWSQEKWDRWQARIADKATGSKTDDTTESSGGN